MAVSTIRSAMAMSTEKIPLPATDSTQTNIQTSAQTTLGDSITSVNRSWVPGRLARWIERFAEQDCEYEELPTSSTTVHCVAGAAAGIAEHCVMYPVDVVKTRRMIVNAPLEARYTGMLNAARVIIKTEGIASLWRGMSVVAGSAGPAHAVYFGTYEYGKSVTGRYLGKNNVKGHLIAGAAASLVHDSIMTPVDAVKQRMQKFGSPFSSVTQCCRQMWRVEGFRAFYRSYLTQIFMNVPQQCVHFATYEYLKRMLNPDNTYDIRIHLCSGFIAGGAAAWITTPFDVVKTFLNTQDTISGRRNITGFSNGLKAVWSTAGPAGLYKGAMPRTLFIAPATAICWVVYEGFKHYLSSSS